MKMKFSLIAMLLFAIPSAFAQNAGDIDTQIKITSDSVNQMIRALKSGPIDEKLNLKDYRSWKEGFDHRVETALIQFEKSMREHVLAKLNDEAQEFLKVSATTQLTAFEKSQVVSEEWTRLVKTNSSQLLYTEATGAVLKAAFQNLPIFGRATDRHQRNYGYFQTDLSNVLTVSFGRIANQPDYDHGYSAENAWAFGLDYEISGLIYGYRNAIYPYIRSQCESRLCVSLMTRKLSEAYKLIASLIDIPREIRIAGRTLTLNPRFDAKLYYSNNFYQETIRANAYPAEVAGLPLDTQ